MTELYAIDIETTGLDPAQDRVTTVAIYNPAASLVIEDTDEVRMLNTVQEWLASLHDGLLVGWNSAVFDFPFIWVRMQLLDMTPMFYLADDPNIVPKYSPITPFRGGVSVLFKGNHGTIGHEDIAYKFKTWAEMNATPWKLKPVARAHGIEVIEVDRTAMAALTVAERMAYNLSDVVATHALAELVLG